MAYFCLLWSLSARKKSGSSPGWNNSKTSSDLAPCDSWKASNLLLAKENFNGIWSWKKKLKLLLPLGLVWLDIRVKHDCQKRRCPAKQKATKLSFKTLETRRIWVKTACLWAFESIQNVAMHWEPLFGPVFVAPQFEVTTHTGCRVLSRHFYQRRRFDFWHRPTQTKWAAEMGDTLELLVGGFANVVGRFGKKAHQVGSGFVWGDRVRKSVIRSRWSPSLCNLRNK